MTRWAMMAMGALALAGCHARPEPPVKTRPDWRFTIDGLAPLMSPAQVAAALRGHGYRHVRCGDDPLLPDPLNQGNEFACYRATQGPMEVSLYFLDLHEGRRLAAASFRADSPDNATPASRLASSQAFAQRLRARLGPPLTSQAGSVFTTYYWGRPGGRPSLPDLVSTTVGKHFEANVNLTSFWAYGEQRPQAESDPGGLAPNGREAP